MGEEEKIFVAYSGGKDSFFLCVALRELGYKVNPIILDIGYNVCWQKGIEVLKPYGIKVEVIDMQYVRKVLEHSIAEKINAYYEMTKDNIKNGLTVCTPCYNGKIVILDSLAKKWGVHEIVFGHHATDVVTSFLKSYLMYQDRYEWQSKFFCFDVFREVVLNYKKIFEKNIRKNLKTKVYFEMEELLYRGLIGTDEPIRQKQNTFDIIRPLFKINEKDIIDSVTKDNLIFQEAECYRMNLREINTLTPREIVKREICEEMELECMEWILTLIESELNDDGTLKYDARRRRTEILGKEYEKNLQSCMKL